MAFWISWVLGFTFIKGIGEPVETYLGWFSYYLITLPIFIAHTYLVAYVLVPTFFNKRLFPIFILLFLLLFYGFSVLELIVSNEFIYKWYPTGAGLTEKYLSTGNVITSGLGNLYIVLVFLASRTVREWYYADLQSRELRHVELQQQMESAISRVQPHMLLYAIDNIDRMVDDAAPDVTRAIALTSELLNEVMIHHEEELNMFSREIDMVRKLVELVTIFRENKPDVEFFVSGDPGLIRIPAMVLFTLVDSIFRRFADQPKLPELNIEASGYSDMITVQVLYNDGGKQGESMQECLQTIQQIESYFRGQVSLSVETHGYGCSVIIRSNSHESVNAIHPPTAVITSPKKVVN